MSQLRNAKNEQTHEKHERNWHIRFRFLNLPFSRYKVIFSTSQIVQL